MTEFFCVCKRLAHLRCAMGQHRVAIAAARQFGRNRRENGLASVGLGGATIGADLSDNRAATSPRTRGPSTRAKEVGICALVAQIPGEGGPSPQGRTR